MTPRVVVAVPCIETWKAEFGQCLTTCMAHTLRGLPDGASLQFTQVHGTDIASLRQRLVREAIAMGATHIQWFDSDMTFPPDTILLLLSHGKAIVAANYSGRRAPIKPTAKQYDGSVVYTDHMSTGLEPCMGAGMGAMLTDVSLFERLAPPWFNMGETDDGAMIGEDYYFCYRALAELEEATWIDHDLSKLVGHVGSYVYTFEDSLEDRVQVRLIKQGKLDEPGQDLPHHRYRSIAGMIPADAAERAKVMESYGRHWRQREDAEEARILSALERR